MEVEELEVDVDGLVDVTVPLLDVVVVVVVLDVEVDVAYVPPVAVVVAVEEAVDGRIADVETGELDLRVKVCV